jgi:hypothetical protein
VLLDGLKPGELFTVRACHDRRLVKEYGDEPRRHLWEKLEQQPPLGVMELEVKARPARKKDGKDKPRPARSARIAQIELRACELRLDLRVDASRKRVSTPPLYAVLACETAASAAGEDPVEWMLLTSYPVRNEDDARLVLRGYAQRWRIEQFHRTWKSGACKVEDTQLRDYDHILRWATVLASVAVRILLLTYLARCEPELPAIEALSQHEIDAIILGSRSKKHRPGTVPPIAEIVESLAKIGGYTGRNSGGPPGALVIARGLFKIEMFALALELDIVRPTTKSDQC